MMRGSAVLGTTRNSRDRGGLLSGSVDSCWSSAGGRISCVPLRIQARHGVSVKHRGAPCIQGHCCRMLPARRCALPPAVTCCSNQASRPRQQGTWAHASSQKRRSCFRGTAHAFAVLSQLLRSQELRNNVCQLLKRCSCNKSACSACSPSLTGGLTWVQGLLLAGP
jgi:hypothetical protein